MADNETGRLLLKRELETTLRVVVVSRCRLDRCVDRAERAGQTGSKSVAESLQMASAEFVIELSWLAYPSHDMFYGFSVHTEWFWASSMLLERLYGQHCDEPLCSITASDKGKVSEQVHHIELTTWLLGGCCLTERVAADLNRHSSRNRSCVVLTENQRICMFVSLNLHQEHLTSCCIMCTDVLQPSSSAEYILDILHAEITRIFNIPACVEVLCPSFTSWSR